MSFWRCLVAILFIIFVFSQFYIAFYIPSVWFASWSALMASFIIINAIKEAEEKNEH